MPLQLFSLFLLLSPLLSTALIAKHGCPDRCGDLPISYPFGVGSDCSLNPYFNIGCDNSTAPPKSYLSIIDKEVIEINQTFIRIKNPYIISACYNLSDNQRVNATGESFEHSMSVNLSATPYTLSYTNRLTAIGCDDAVLQSSGGCSAVCTGMNDTASVGYCSFNASASNGCCQAKIGGGTTFLEAKLSDLSGRLGRRKLLSCSYAFIQDTMDSDENIFLYPLYYLHNSTALLNDDWASTTRSPVVRLDWIVGAENCSKAKSNSTTYACRDDNSMCVDIVDVGTAGYLCSCVQGYEGNPYLPGGCQEAWFSSSITRLGCSDHCGELSISFPFGVGPNCFLAPSFEVVCNTTTNPPKAYIRAINTEIVYLDSSQVWINYPHFASTCYNSSDNETGLIRPEKQSLIIDLLRTQYTLSDGNWITAVGCDDMVVAVIGKDNRSSIRSSCAAICSNREISLGSFGRCPYVTTMYSPGDGCCRAPMPRGTTYLEANLTDLSGLWPRTNFSCSYAFVEYMIDEHYFLTYSFLNNMTGIRPEVLFPETNWGPSKLALDWRIGAENCNEARRDPANFACQANSDCVDFDAMVGVGGYLCSCSKGYQGNPYLTTGCQDIDECAHNKTNPCDSYSICINIPGSVICLCPKGYYGDGRKHGRGCIPLPISKSKMIVLSGMGSALGFLLLLLMCFWLFKVLKRRKEKIIREKFFKRNGGLLLQQLTKEGAVKTTKVFPTKELEVATDNFNESRVLGRGGQGTVYKGMLSDGMIVAIKKSKLVQEDQVEQFINEVVILSQINHKNVVKLLGCCLETEVPMLVYEFMPNGTLFELIHDPNKEFPFSWSMRLKIAMDIAGALAYLHSASSVPIYHRDIKSSNILLNEKNVVKVSDFGTSRSVAADQTHLTTLVKGTFGYLDPEYFQSSQFTEKSDVYSFGVVLVELLTGKRPVSLDRDCERNLASRFLTCMEDNYLDTILDPQVLENSRKEEVILVAKLAERCLNLKGIMRPTMKEVAIELESFRISQMSSIAREEYEEVRDFEASPMMDSDIEYICLDN